MNKAIDMERMADRSAAAAKAEDVEREHGGDGKQTGFVYTARTWNSDCANYLVSTSAERNNEVRRHLQRALNILDYAKSFTGPTVFQSQMVAADCLRLGFQILQNAIDNGLTLENVGADDDN